MKKFLLSIILIAAVMMMPCAFAQLTKTNVSMTKVYSPSQVFEGKFNLSLKNYPVDSMAALNINSWPMQEISLSEFLALNNVPYNCTPANCLSYYTVSNPSENKTINGEKYIALVVNGKNIQIKSLQFQIVGENIKPECYKTPLMFDILDDMIFEWKYLVAGEGYCDNFISSDAYNADPAVNDYSYNLKDTPYCERIKLPIGSNFTLAADIETGDTDMDVEISIGNSGFNENSKCGLSLIEGGTGIASCDVYFPALDEKTYEVCIKVSANYDPNSQNPHKLKGERVDPFSGYASGQEMSFDFAIYAKPADFANFTEITLFDNSQFFGKVPSNAKKGEELKTYLQNYINALTDNTKNCQDKQCIIPIKVVSNQNVVFSNLVFVYSISGVDYTANKFYDSSKQSANMNASGIMRAETAGFKVPVAYSRYTFSFNIGNDLIDSGSLSVVKIPNIVLTPLNVFAGVSARFDATVAEENISRYYWDFGDGIKTETSASFAEHTYSAIGAYTLILTAKTLKGINATKSFLIYAGTPKNIVNTTLIQKTDYLSKLQTDLNSMPAWYKSIALTQLNMAELLKTLQAYQTESLNPESDFVALKAKLDNFIVYKGIKSEDIGITPVQQNVNIDLLKKAGAGSIQDRARLESSIKDWQGFFGINAKAKVSIAESEKPGNNLNVLTVVTVEITPSGAPPGKVFVILEGMANAKFQDNESHNPIDGSEIFIFDSLTAKKEINFSVAGSYNPADLSIITSPEFSSFLVGEYYCGNMICDKDKNESYKTCPEDCKKPMTSRIIYALIVLIAAAGGIYFIWKVYVRIYENNLEKKLFKNRADLYNLTFFIGKALNKNEKEEDIRKKLIEAKWNPDQVDFALMKIKKERRAVQFNTLKNFISSELKMSKNEEAIKNELKEAGWQQKDIDYAYKKTIDEVEKGKKMIIAKSAVASQRMPAAAVTAAVKKRNILLVYVFSIITLGIYGLYWMVSTRKELNALGADIPTAWLIIVPIANIYWLYKYAEGFSKLKRDSNAVLWFLLFLLVGIATPAIVQSELNKYAK